MLGAEVGPGSVAPQRHATSTTRAVGRRAVTCVYSVPGGFRVRKKATIASRSAGAIRLYQAKGIVRLRRVPSTRMPSVMARLICASVQSAMPCFEPAGTLRLTAAALALSKAGSWRLRHEHRLQCL